MRSLAIYVGGIVLMILFTFGVVTTVRLIIEAMRRRDEKKEAEVEVEE